MADVSITGMENRLLNKWQAAALLTADCVGVGILALSHDVQVLGWSWGVGFLIVNLPINYFAGHILARAATQVEELSSSSSSSSVAQFGRLEMIEQHHMVSLGVADGAKQPSTFPRNRIGQDTDCDPADGDLEPEISSRQTHKHKGRHHLYEATPLDDTTANNTESADNSLFSCSHIHDLSLQNTQIENGDGLVIDKLSVPVHCDLTGMGEQWKQNEASAAATADLVAISANLFHGSLIWTRVVLLIYYLNIFLVLGDYLLVMSHAVTAMVGENQICLPMAGVLASVLIFAVCQLNTMAILGREASMLSLIALLIVLLQCLRALRSSNETWKRSYEADDGSVLRKFSALASIGFAVGSQKLFLNIRNEMALKNEASQTLAISLTSFGLAYILVVLLAGSNAPAFLFDAIPGGIDRRVTGFLLWGHVAVSYAINSQALCSSMDRMFFHNVRSWNLNDSPRRRWLVLTFGMTLLSYLVSNAIPFFKDLVSLIGALTSVPLSLALPALLYQKACSHASFIEPTSYRFWSFWLLFYSLLFLCVGLAGSMSSIEKDWRLHGRPFSCH